MATTIQLKRGLAADIEAANPVLAQGEPVFATDTGILKIGDGTTAYNDLTGISGAGGGGMEIGTIYSYAGTVAPVGSLICNGSAISRTEYADLFAAIGTTWGVGDGSTTFNLPDLRGAFLRGAGSHGSATMADGNPFAGPAVGSTENDQMQGHEHELQTESGSVTDIVNGDLRLVHPGNAGSYTSVTYQGGKTSQGFVGVGTADSDGTNGTPRTGDETRPFAAGVTYCIKATPATNSGDPLPTYSYSTGWIANSDWTNMSATISHGLGSALTDGLIVQFCFAEDLNGTNEQILWGTDGNVNDSGITFRPIDTNSFEFATGTAGVVLFNSNMTVRLQDTEAGYYKINVWRPEVLATEVETLKYDTGWVANSDWLAATLSITHNLGAHLSSLIAKVFLSPDGTDAASMELRPANDYGSTADDVGWNLHEVDVNQIQFVTADNGLYVIKSNGLTEYLSDDAWYYRVVVYKPAILEAASPVGVRAVLSDYTVKANDSEALNVTPGATDITITLPSTTEITPGWEVFVNKVGTGAGNVILSSADLLRDGASLDSEGDYAHIMWNGNKFIFKDFFSHGSNSNGSYVVFSSGLQVCWRKDTESIAINNSWGSIYASAAQAMINFPKAFASPPATTIFVGRDSAFGNASILVGGNRPSTTQWGEFYLARGTSSGALDRVIDRVAIGMSG